MDGSADILAPLAPLFTATGLYNTTNGRWLVGQTDADIREPLDLVGKELCGQVIMKAHSYKNPDGVNVVAVRLDKLPY